MKGNRAWHERDLLFLFYGGLLTKQKNSSTPMPAPKIFKNSRDGHPPIKRQPQLSIWSQSSRTKHGGSFSKSVSWRIRGGVCECSRRRIAVCNLSVTTERTSLDKMWPQILQTVPQRTLQKVSIPFFGDCCLTVQPWQRPSHVYNGRQYIWTDSLRLGNRPNWQSTWNVGLNGCQSIQKNPCFPRLSGGFDAVEGESKRWL